MGQLTRSSSKTFAPAPEGLYQAVLVDVVDHGHNEKSFAGSAPEMVPEIQLVWQIEERREDGTRFLVFGRRVKPSMHEKANLRKTLDAWFGKKAIEKALETAFDTESLIGKNARLQIQHNDGSDGTVYANITAVLPWTAKDGPEIVPEGYTRRCERDDYVPPAVSAFERLTPEPAASPATGAALPGETDGALLGQIMGLGATLFGADITAKLDAMARKESGGKRDVYHLTGTEASALLGKLREPSLSMKEAAKAQPAQPTPVVDDDIDPFEDQ